MTKKKKQRRSQTTRQRKYGTWFLVGQIMIIFGAILAIVAAILDIISNFVSDISNTTWASYTFGQFNLDYLGPILALIMAFIILWLAVDRRVYNRLNLYLYAVLIIVLAVIAGNVGALIVIIGALIIIFYRISKE
ncbi:MAG: hypothetical protein JXA54_04130 [Candidatus Heimdallarchaeota archaeon]|nr:hypothetical protein [Candidatus Heimdallarchaeota archaeon]